MRKNVFRKIAQSICIGAIGLLAGTSLDYAYSGYGILNNPNLWAESTTTAAAAAPVDTMYTQRRPCTCFGKYGEYKKSYEGNEILVSIERELLVELDQYRCSSDCPKNNKICTPESSWGRCKYSCFDRYGKKIDSSCE